MGITIKDVAKRSGTSISSVSRYINGNQIRESNRVKIEQAIKELNYEVNISAKSLKTNKSMIVGIVIPYLTRIYDVSIVKGINNVINQNSYYSFIIDTDNDFKKEKEALDFLYNKKVDGVIVFPSSDDKSIYQKFIESNIPIVFIDQKIDSIKGSCVVADNTNAVYQAVEYLIKKGHSDISIICGPQNMFTAKERLLGYYRALNDYGIPVREELIKSGEYDMYKGYDRMIELIDMPNRPTAVIVTNYDMTKGAVLALNERNINIPEDISFIGYDEYDLTNLYKPKLSIIMQPMMQMGEKAANVLLKLMKGDESYYNKVYRLKTEFIENKSVKKL